MTDGNVVTASRHRDPSPVTLNGVPGARGQVQQGLGPGGRVLVSRGLREGLVTQARVVARASVRVESDRPNGDRR